MIIMTLLMPSYLLLTAVAVGTARSLGISSDLCGDRFFYSLVENKCKKCSVCPTNKIIIDPCTKYSDLKCGPFSFNDFPDFSSNQVDETFEDGEYYFASSTNRKKTKVPSRRKSYSEDMESPTTIEKEDREYWKTLAFALIGLLSVLIIVATVVVLLACRKLQRATVVKQPDEGDMADDADSGYVVIRAIRIATDTRPANPDLSFYTKDEYGAHPPLLGPAASDPDLHSVMDPNTCRMPHHRRLCFLPKVYKPQRRLLNYDADDVFESDDSSTSRTSQTSES